MFLLLFCFVNKINHEISVFFLFFVVVFLSSNFYLFFILKYNHKYMNTNTLLPTQINYTNVQLIHAGIRPPHKNKTNKQRIKEKQTNKQTNNWTDKQTNQKYYLRKNPGNDTLCKILEIPVV